VQVIAEKIIGLKQQNGVKAPYGEFLTCGKESYPNIP